MIGRPAAGLRHDSYDVVVLGGGVTGASVAWHAARRGLRVAMVERDDFGGGATANCLKIVHGGLRYLQHADLRRMRQSIAERSAWLRSAPHLVEPLPVLMPTFRGTFPPRWMLAGALAVNEAVSADRNRRMLPERRLPVARVLSRRECVERLPSLDLPGLTGGILFHDAIMYSPERLTLELVLAAHRAGADVVNHAEFLEVIARQGRVSGVRLRLRAGGAVEVGTRWLVNATGSAAGSLAARITGSAWREPQHYSVALNLVTRRSAPPVAYTVSAGAADPDRVVRSGRRQLFVVPWRGQTLVGTAHLPFSGDPSRFELRDSHVESFLAEAASATPSLDLTHDDVVLVHRGLLPVADGSATNAVRLLKRHRVLDHAADGVAGALSVVSVKFTTAHVIARDVVARIAGGSVERTAAARDAANADVALPGAAFPSLDGLRADARARFGGLLNADALEHLLRTYGSRYTEVMGCAGVIDDWDRPVAEGTPVIQAQLVHGAVAEFAVTAEDLLWRRTEIGPRGLISGTALERAEAALSTAKLLHARHARS